jgi:putative DNA primase/helicase
MPARLIRLLVPVPPPPARPFRPRDDKDQRVADALMRIPVDRMNRHDWVRIGMALHSHFGAAGLRLWEEWSRQSEHHNRPGLVKTWKSFKAGGVTVATVFHYAREHRHVA